MAKLHSNDAETSPRQPTDKGCRDTPTSTKGEDLQAACNYWTTVRRVDGIDSEPTQLPSHSYKNACKGWTSVNRRLQQIATARLQYREGNDGKTTKKYFACLHVKYVQILFNMHV